MPKISYFLILLTSLSSIPFSHASHNSDIVEFKIFEQGDFGHNNYNRVIDSLKQDGLADVHHGNTQRYYLQIKKSDLKSSVNGSINSKDLYKYLDSIISKAYSPTGLWYIEFEISKPLNVAVDMVISKDLDGCTVDLNSQDLKLSLVKVKLNDKVPIIGIIIISLATILGYYLYFKNLLKRHSLRKKRDQGSSFKKSTVKEEASTEVVREEVGSSGEEVEQK